SNKSTFSTDEAMFVVSDNGDILSPKNAPETTAPAVIASDISNVLAIPINATPTVPTVVNELPILIPIMDATTNTIARKNFGVTKLKPKYTNVGIVPPIIQALIKIPIKKKINVAAIPTFAPSVIPSSISLYATFFIKPYTIKNSTAKIIGICGTVSKKMILKLIMKIITAETNIASIVDGI